MKMKRIKVLLATAIVLAGSACGSEVSPSPTRDAPESEAPAPGGTESATANPRLAVAHDGGLLVVDVTSGEVVLEEEVPGFVRVAQAGDDRHVLVAAASGWHVLDTGSWRHAHGDHDHHYTAQPALTEVQFEAAQPGHAVVHDGHTTLFDDATGTITTFDPHDLAHGAPETTDFMTDEPHHGVAVMTQGRNVLHTVGDEESRSGVRLVGPGGHVLAETDQCPGVHGEAFAQTAAVFGCEDGVVVVDGRTMTKVGSPDDSGRIGTLAGSDASPVMLADYKSDPDAEHERPTRVSLVDTERHTMRLVDTGASYSFRSLGRGPAGEVLVLGTDGRLRVISPDTGKVTGTVDVIAKWREPLDWQLPRPALSVAGETAYVSEPATDSVHVIDLTTLEVVSTISLPHTPHEITANEG